MGVLSIVLLVTVIGVGYYFVKSGYLFRKASKAIALEKIAYHDGMEAQKKLSQALNNQVIAKDALIKAIVIEFEKVAMKNIQQRLTIMQTEIPHLRASQELFYKMDDLKTAYENDTIDIFKYYAEVNLLLDVASTKQQ
jgi:hypothetical protein